MHVEPQVNKDLKQHQQDPQVVFTSRNQNSYSRDRQWTGRSAEGHSLPSTLASKQEPIQITVDLARNLRGSPIRKDIFPAEPKPGMSSPTPPALTPKDGEEKVQLSNGMEGPEELMLNGLQDSGSPLHSSSPITTPSSTNGTVSTPPLPPPSDTNATTPPLDAVSFSSHMTASSSTAKNQSTASPMHCAACQQPMTGQFVKALGTVYHLDCFRCGDCDTVVAQKFFPIEGENGKQQPLCETDYFRRLNLICAKCGLALRGSYITACNKKFHVEHFSCSICPTLFGQQDSYYEHEDNVYCHYHYSTRFATKCVGCNSAILKQYVEINRNMKDECWHPECYMIHKFWNVKVWTRRSGSPSMSQTELATPPYLAEEEIETPASLKEKQQKMEQQVYKIWTVLSAFEESSAACISDMLRHVSNGQYLEAIRMAEKFILHVEVLFATIDDLEHQFSIRNAKGMSHVREARMLCRKTVDLFTLLSRPQESEAKRSGMTQDLLALVTGLAHYLKILIRIALTGGLKLDREQATREPLSSMLQKLHLLAVNGGNPTARRLVNKRSGEQLVANGTGDPSSSKVFATQGVKYGFSSLAPENAGDSPFWGRDPNAPPGHIAPKMPSPPSDLCVLCNLTVEEDCVRLGTYQRWHSTCVKCKVCGKQAAPPVAKSSPPSDPNTEEKDKDSSLKQSSTRRPPANVSDFLFEEVPGERKHAYNIFCVSHQTPGCRDGFDVVSRLEQYAFLLNVALRRLYVLLKQKGIIQVIAESTDSPRSSVGSSQELLAVKSVHLDRKLSATARMPQRSTVVESPSGRTAQPTTFTGYQKADAQRLPTHLEHPIQSQPQRPTRPEISQQRPSPPASAKSSAHPPPPPIRIGDSPQSSPTSPHGEHVLRPDFARNNTRVKIVDDPTVTTQDPDLPRVSDDALTLADIPGLVEVEQAVGQRGSFPYQSARPLISDLSPLELAIIKHCAVLALYKSSLKDHMDLDDILDFIEVKKGGFWKQLFKGTNDKAKYVKKKGVFGIPLELLVERDGFDSTLGVTKQPLRVPSFIDDLVSAMRQMDMSIEGIFRKNGNIKRLNQLIEAIDRDPGSVDLTTDNPVQLAALLKRFLRELPDPLFTFRLHRLFLSTQSLQDNDEFKRLLHMVSILLPKAHQDTLHVLFVFMKWVASFAHIDEAGNKMDLPNLATVIAPNILYAKGRDPTRQESLSAGDVVSEYLAMQDDFFMVPEEFMEILHDQEYFNGALDMPSKDFLKKCETYMKLKSKGRVPLGPNSELMSPILNGSHTPFHPQGPPFAPTHPPTKNERSDDNGDVRLVPQRSDPALSRAELSRGRTTVSDGHQGRRHSPQRKRYQLRDSRSLERGASEYPSYSPRIPGQSMSPHPGLSHQPLSQPVYPSSYDGTRSLASASQEMLNGFTSPSWSRANDMDRSPSTRSGAQTPRGSIDYQRAHPHNAAPGRHK